MSIKEWIMIIRIREKYVEIGGVCYDEWTIVFLSSLDTKKRGMTE